MAWFKGQHTRQMSKNEVVAALEESQKEVTTLSQDLRKLRIELENVRKELQQEKSINESIGNSAIIPILLAAANSTQSWQSLLDKIKKDLDNHYKNQIQTIVDSAIEKHMDDYRHEFIEPRY